MKTINYFSIVVLLFSIQITAQRIDTNYFPEKHQETSDKKFAIAKKLLSNAYEVIEKEQSLYWVDYWNLAHCYAYMNVSNSYIYELLSKAKKANSKNFCSMIVATVSDVKGNIKNSIYYKRLGNQFLELIEDCNGNEIQAISVKKMNQLKKEQNLNYLNEALIDKLITLMEKDQRYRYRTSVYKKNWKKQTELDSEVSIELIKIFEEYGYPGKSLVGENFMNYACLLLEHGARIKDQEKYLPLVAKAFKNNELNGTYFSMLIDRIYWKKTGKQIFGSHANNIPFAEESVIEEVKNKYGFKKTKR